MNDKPVDPKASTPATTPLLETHWQFGPSDLFVPDGGREMPNVRLDTLCDIIFADVAVTKTPER